MGFPPAGAHVYYNEEGEPTGWDNPSYDEPEYCGICGGNHSEFKCPVELNDDDD